jgi:hypothetical protein
LSGNFQMHRYGRAAAGCHLATRYGQALLVVLARGEKPSQKAVRQRLDHWHGCLLAHLEHGTGIDDQETWAAALREPQSPANLPLPAGCRLP